MLHKLATLAALAYGWVVTGALSYAVCLILDSISGSGF